MTTSEILRAAAARVRQGWCQGNFWSWEGGACALGAICDVWWLEDEDADPDPGTLGGTQPVVALERALGLERDGVSAWNDAPGQTAEGVAIGLEFAALWFDEQQKHTAAHVEA